MLKTDTWDSAGCDMSRTRQSHSCSDRIVPDECLCEYLKDCTTPAGSKIGPWDYVDQDEFEPNAPVPKLEYMDDPIWKNQEEWRASAPYAIHFQLARSNGPALYVDELNWWPLTFALKCRQIIASRQICCSGKGQD